MEISKITPIILCGGLGTRFQEVSTTTPKATYKVNEEPFINIILNDLQKVGFKECILATGHLSNCIKSTLGQRYKNLQLHYSEEENPLGTGGAISNALKLDTKERVLIINGDSFIEEGINKILKTEKNSILISNYKNQYDYTQMGQVLFDRSTNKVNSFIEKNEKLISHYINTGIYLIDKCLLSEIQNRKCSFEKDIIPKIIKDGLYVVKSLNKVYDIGTTVGLNIAKTELFKK